MLVLKSAFAVSVFSFSLFCRGAPSAPVDSVASSHRSLCQHPSGPFCAPPQNLYPILFQSSAQRGLFHAGNAKRCWDAFLRCFRSRFSPQSRLVYTFPRSLNRAKDEATLELTWLTRPPVFAAFLPWCSCHFFLSSSSVFLRAASR